MALWQTEGKRVKKKPENHMRQVEGAGGGGMGTARKSYFVNYTNNRKEKNGGGVCHQYPQTIHLLGDRNVICN